MMTANASVRGVFLVAHGLNLLPFRMLPLAQWLADEGYQVFKVELSGHRNIPGELAQVSAAGWREEFSGFYEVASKRAHELGVPLLFLGFSLGALIGLGFEFERLILFAPPLVPRWPVHLIRLLDAFPGSFPIPSLSPLGYRAQSATPLAAYRALIDLRSMLDKSGKMNQVSAHALVFLNPRDELVSWNGIMRWISHHDLARSWKLEKVSPSDDSLGTYHHLIIDPSSVGRVEWNRMTQVMRDFLRGS